MSFKNNKYRSFYSKSPFLKKKCLFLNKLLWCPFSSTTIVTELNNTAMKTILLSLLIFMTTILSFGQQNQNIEMSKIESGSYLVFKPVEKSYNKFVFEQAKKNWPVELFQEGNRFPKILIKKVGILDEFYEADLPNYPAYYLTKVSNINITVIDKKVFYYTWTASKGATINYILMQSGKPGKFTDEKTVLDTYRRSIKKNQTGAREDRIAENAAIAKKEAEDNTLKGKSIKSMTVKFVDKPENIGMLSVVSIGIEIELTNGVILKTKNLGGKTPYTDFESSVKGGDYAGGDFKVANDSRDIPNDKIEIKIWSKYDKTAKAEFSHALNYKSNINYQFQGRGGKNGRGMTAGRSEHGTDGSDGKSVNITADLQTINGEKINIITITNAMTGEVLAMAKLHVNNKITINVKGGNGGNGENGKHNHSGDGGDGGSGGNGGDVMLSGNGAQSLLITVLNQGGSAGAGGSAKTNYNSTGSKGSRGSKGTFIK